MANNNAGVLVARALAAGALVVWGGAGAGCASGAVQRGALIGAASGAALGVGTGLLISDKDLLGSPETLESGNLSLGTGEAVGAGVAIGVVFGAIVGAMIGHSSDDEPQLEQPKAASTLDAADPATTAQVSNDLRLQATARVSRPVPVAF
jgi:hypothetical protein